MNRETSSRPSARVSALAWTASRNEAMVSAKGDVKTLASIDATDRAGAE
jgi:hypothetical protein